MLHMAVAAAWPCDQSCSSEGRTLFMNFLHTERISLANVAENIMTCLSWGVSLKMACTSLRMSACGTKTAEQTVRDRSDGFKCSAGGLRRLRQNIQPLPLQAQVPADAQRTRQKGSLQHNTPPHKIPGIAEVVQLTKLLQHLVTLINDKELDRLQVKVLLKSKLQAWTADSGVPIVRPSEVCG